MNAKQVLSYTGILAILVLVVMVIALSLLGPAIGNVFSNIVSNYSVPSGSYTSYATSPTYDSGSTFGGLNPVNDEPYRDMFFENYGVNPFIDTEDDPLSTFALDVDTSSYSIVRSYLRDGNLPPKEAVRVEEFVNDFDMHYPPPENDTFAIFLDGGPTPFVQNEHYRVIRIGIQGMLLSDDARKDAVLTFVIDVSGSMADGSRLEMVKSALTTLVQNLRPTDQVGIVTYNDTASILLPISPVSEGDMILNAISKLQPRGSTNAEAGLKFGYQMANRAYTSGAINRVILCSDGVANVGVTGYEGILKSIHDSAEGGITLTTVGVGLGIYNDVLLEQLADQGDGFYAYIDTVEEAEKLFMENLTSTLQTIALDAKVQVAFNPEVVSRYRLIGYENRGMKDEEFEDSSADAGEIGVGHSVTALYEIKLVEGASGQVATVSLRWKDPDSLLNQALRASIEAADFAPRFEATSPSFQLVVLVAEFAEILRESYWAQQFTLGDLQQVVRQLDFALLQDPEVAEFAQLIQQARSLADNSRTNNFDPQPTSDLPAPAWPEPTPIIFPTPTAVSYPLPTSLPATFRGGYGYSEVDPIRVGGGPDHGPLREQWYLNSLRGPEGQALQFQRMGSIAPSSPAESPWGSGALDIYEVTYVGLNQPIELYIDMYRCEAPRAPQGFSFTPDPALPSGKLVFINQSAILAEELAYNMLLLDGETQCMHHLPIHLGDGAMPFSVSPDGSRLVFTLLGDEYWHLFIANLDGSQVQQLTDGEFYDLFPSWSPNGDQIVFLRSDENQADLYRISLVNGELIQLTNDPHLEFMPAWSPDGSQITFSSDHTGNEEIFMINSDGTGLRQLTHDPGSNLYAIWSPEGKILFNSDGTGRSAFYLMDADGDNLEKIFDADFMAQFPAWSPDGQQIAFCSEQEGNYDLYLIHADGSELVRLTEAWSADCLPQWVH